MRVNVIGAVLGAVIAAGAVPSAAAGWLDPYNSGRLFANPKFNPLAPKLDDTAHDPRNCLGPEQEIMTPLSVARVTASARVNFVNSPHDDESRAASCPAATAVCRNKAYLVTGDLVLVGRTGGDFTCVSYQSPSGKKRGETVGWLPSAALSPVAPMASPEVSDWLGSWTGPRGAKIAIARGGLGGRLRVEGESFILSRGGGVHMGALDAQVNPEKDSILLLDDGWLPWETKSGDGCRVRMRRFGPLLLVEDNVECGDLGVSFTGFYRRSR